MPLRIASEVFADRATIPEKYSCQGDDISPPLTWSEPPAGTASYALIVDDPDSSQVFTHWLIYNIPAGRKHLAEGVARQPKLDDGVLQGQNDFGRPGYGGPCPPPGREHHYRFRLYALDAVLDIGPGSSKARLLEALEGHILDRSELTGRFRRRA